MAGGSLLAGSGSGDCPAAGGGAADPIRSALLAGRAAVWLRPPGAASGDETPLSRAEVADAEARLSRFRPALAELFPQGGWDGRIASPLVRLDAGVDGFRPLLVKCDHELPMTGSVKARGGVYELLCRIEERALAAGLLATGDDYRRLLEPGSRAALAGDRVFVASTGNLGFSIGLVARAFGVPVEIHMSHDAKEWKKDRLRRLGADVVEHASDYTAAVAHARVAAASHGGYFIDDESSRRLFVGYATAAREVSDQLAALGIHPTVARPLYAYLPCGVGGAPGGIAAGLSLIHGDAVRPVFVEPVASACVLAALAFGGGRAVSVYDVGLDNRTVADGLAVAAASDMVLDSVGSRIHAAVAVPDADMMAWVRRAWERARLRLEPSAASGLAALAPFAAAVGGAAIEQADHLVWTTGGSLLPDAEFEALLGDDAERA